jgi:hypothetical protein
MITSELLRKMNAYRRAVNDLPVGFREPISTGNPARLFRPRMNTLPGLDLITTNQEA